MRERDRIKYRIKKTIEWGVKHKIDIGLVDVLEEALNTITFLLDQNEKWYKMLEQEQKTVTGLSYNLLCSPRRVNFPVAVGETVKTVCIEEDELGNPIATLVPWEVKGVAYKDGKYFAIDDSGELYECGTRQCIIPEPRRTVTDI